MRFKRVEQANEMIQLGELQEKEKQLMGRRLILLKDNNNKDCLFILGAYSSYWLFVSKGKIYIHKGGQEINKQIRCASLFSTTEMANACMICEDKTLKIIKLHSDVIFGNSLPFRRRQYPGSATKIIQINEDEKSKLEGKEEKYYACIFREWIPVSFQVTSVPQALKQQLSTILNVFGEKYCYSIALIKQKYI